MTPALRVVDAVLRCAASHLAVREVPGNHGRFVNAIQAYAGGKDGEPWCADWVYYVAHHMLEDQWPLPRTGSCDVLLRFAETHDLLTERPDVGGLFLVLTPTNLRDAVHVGFVEALHPERGPLAFQSLEGNSNEMGEREGIGVFRNLRGYDAFRTHPADARHYAFVDWVRLLNP